MEQVNKSGTGAKLKLIIVPLLLVLALFAAYVAQLAVPGAWLWVAVVIATTPTVAAIVAVLLALGLIALFWRRHWISGAAMLAGLIALVVAAEVPNPADSVAGKIADLVHVISYSSTLQQQVQQLRDHGDSPAIALVVSMASAAWHMVLPTMKPERFCCLQNSAASHGWQRRGKRSLPSKACRPGISSEVIIHGFTINQYARKGTL
jgi:hypothetical protein